MAALHIVSRTERPRRLTSIGSQASSEPPHQTSAYMLLVGTLSYGQPSMPGRLEIVIFITGYNCAFITYTVLLVRKEIVNVL